MISPQASVIIPTRNRPRAIERCLDALAAQTMPAGTFEVIAVDDGSSTPLLLDAARWSGKFPLKVIRQENTGPAGARNRGVEAASGAFIAFTDDDCRPMPEWLETMAAALRKSPGALIGGTTVNELDDDILAETSQLIVDLVYAHFNRDPSRAYFFASNNMGVCRNDYLDSGGFDAYFRVASEDREFCDRWRMQGRPLIWEQQALVHHGHPQNLREFATLHFRYGQGACHYQNKRRERSSGTMREDMGFHRGLPAAVLEKTARYRFSERFRITASLLLWQAANLAGFLYAWCKGRNTGRGSKAVADTH